MNCPKCGQKCGHEMEHGYLDMVAPTSGGLIPTILVMRWKDDSTTPKTEDRWWWVHGRARSDRIVDKRSWLGGVDVNLEAYKCEKCQYILFSYEKMEKRQFLKQDKLGNYADVEKHMR